MKDVQVDHIQTMPVRVSVEISLSSGRVVAFSSKAWLDRTSYFASASYDGRLSRMHVYVGMLPLLKVQAIEDMGMWV